MWGVLPALAEASASPCSCLPSGTPPLLFCHLLTNVALEGWPQTGQGTCVSIDPRTNVSRLLSIWRSSRNTLVGRVNNVRSMDSFFKGRGLGYVHNRTSLYHLLAASRKMHQSPFLTVFYNYYQCSPNLTQNSQCSRAPGSYGIWSVVLASSAYRFITLTWQGLRERIVPLTLTIILFAVLLTSITLVAEANASMLPGGEIAVL
jgi:hypothetical protein